MDKEFTVSASSEPITIENGKCSWCKTDCFWARDAAESTFDSYMARAEEQKDESSYNYENSFC